MTATIDREEALQIAQTIVYQMGGAGALKMMVGATDFTFDAKDDGDVALTFTFKMCRKANRCEVTLNRGLDTYTMRLYRVVRKAGAAATIKVAYQGEDLYCDQLREVFRLETGLEIRVPRVFMGAA